MTIILPGRPSQASQIRCHLSMQQTLEYSVAGAAKALKLSERGVRSVLLQSGVMVSES